MIEFDFSELNLLNKLLNKVKYSELSPYELNQFSNSPITNQIMEKIQAELKPFLEKPPQINNKEISKFEFKLENHVGKAITNRLEHMDLASFQAIVESDKSEIENFAKDILGIIDFEASELNKLTEYIIKKAKEKTNN